MPHSRVTTSVAITGKWSLMTTGMTCDRMVRQDDCGRAKM